MNIVIPMAGKASRFKEAGYTTPKPFIDVNGQTMIQRVVENIGLPGKYIFITLREHYEQFHLKYLLPLICKENKCEIVIVDEVTEGAACTVLLAKEFITDDELLLVNSDQLVDWAPNHFLDYMRRQNADGGIVTFLATQSKWSFVKIQEESGIITEIAEKNPISNAATVGIYWFKNGNSFIEGAKSMILKDIRTNGEYYVAPVFNELVGMGHKIYNYPIAKMYGLGVPHDLEKYLSKGF